MIKRNFVIFTTCLLLWPASVISGKVYEHTEIVSAFSQYFYIEVGGSVDPENLEIQIENIGDTAAINPRITVNRRYNWYTLEGLLEEIIDGCQTEQEIAMAIFNFVVQNSYWWGYPTDRTSIQPVRHFNIYGYHICSQAASIFTALCRTAGLEARVYEIWHHTVAEVKWEGSWHHMDPDLGVWYLKGDNKSIASIEELEKNPEWVARSYQPYRWYLTPGENKKRIYEPGKEPGDHNLATYYGTSNDNYVETAYDGIMNAHQSMDMTLRPREKIVRWWRPVLRKYYDQNSKIEPPRYANGQLIFIPDFDRFAYEATVDRENIKFRHEDGQSPMVHVDRLQDPVHDRPSQFKISMQSPYVMVGGYIDTRYYKGATGRLNKLSLSADLDPLFGQVTKLWSYYSWAYGEGESRAWLDEKMLRGGLQATYAFSATYQMSADKADADILKMEPHIYGGQSGVDQIRIIVDLQVNPSSLPALSLGRNRVHYTDDGADGRKVRITYKWREIDQQHKPSAPNAAVYPLDSATINQTAPRFEWLPATDQDGDEIASYQFQLSLRPDCAWPISQTFDRDVQQDRNLQSPPGWLNPGTTYYWRVRAVDAKGYIGPWSRVFSFEIRS